jgi:predicted Zn finger-like uncharacterized protein
MSLITRCPACGTMFKVVADQLRISEGWVRCGHCSEIFDATANLQDEARLPRPVPLARPADEHAVDSEMLGASGISGFGTSVHSHVDDSIVSGTPDPMEIEEQVEVLLEHPLDRPFELRRPDTPETPEPGPHGYSRPAPLVPEPELHDLSFVRQARRKAFWRSPVVRVMLGLLALVLAALLAAQVAVHDRNRLAATQPALRPWLAKIFEPLRCALGPPRQIESISIDSSTFNKLRGDTFRLNVTLRNQGASEVAMPALELTLTDSQDQAVVRRVLQATEVAPNAAAIAAGADWSTSLAFAVSTNGGPSRIAGYRLLAFYP